MRALRFHRFGGPEVLQLDDVPVPTPGPQQVRIQVTHAALNFADTERRRGLYLREVEPPVVLGSECVGVVDAVGPGVEGAWVGRRVVALAREAQAQFCVAGVDDVTSLPESVSSVAAAAQFLKALTAWHVTARVRHMEGRVGGLGPPPEAVEDDGGVGGLGPPPEAVENDVGVGGLGPGLRRNDGGASHKLVLVTAAAGGVGLLIIQLAKQAGAQVIALASTAEKRAFALKYGADAAFALDEHTVEKVSQFTRGRGVDLLCDSVGRPVQPLVPQLLAPFGHWVSFGDAGGPLEPVAPALLFEKSLTFSSWWLKTPRSAQAKQAAAAEVLRRLAEKKLALPFEVLPLSQAQQAHQRLESRHVQGGLVFDLSLD